MRNTFVFDSSQYALNELDFSEQTKMPVGVRSIHRELYWSETAFAF